MSQFMFGRVVSVWFTLQGRILLPGAAMFEMVRAAAACLGDGGAGERLGIRAQRVT